MILHNNSDFISETIPLVSSGLFWLKSENRGSILFGLPLSKPGIHNQFMSVRLSTTVVSSFNMPNLHNTNKSNSKVSSLRKTQVAPSTKTTHSSNNRSDGKKRQAKETSRSPPRRRPGRQTRSSSASRTSNSSSSDTDSDGSSSDSSASSKTSSKKTARAKENKLGDRSKAVGRTAVSKADTVPTAVPKTSESRLSNRDQPKRTSTVSAELPKPAEPARTETAVRSKAPVSAPEVTVAAVPQPVAVCPSPPTEKSAAQKVQTQIKPSTKTSKINEADAEQLPKDRSKSPTEAPPFTRILVEKLTRNITKGHIMEIFSVWGEIQSVDMPADRLHPEFSRSYAYVNYENPKSAADAVSFMNGGQIDGEVIRVTEVFTRPTASSRNEGPTTAPEKTLYRDRDPNKREPEQSSTQVRPNKDNIASVPRRLEDQTDRRRERERPVEDSDRKRDIRDRERDRQRDRERERERQRDRSRDRDHVRSGRFRRARRDSSGSPFANRSGPPARQRSPLVGLRYRRPSPPVSSKNDTSGARRPRSRSPIGKPVAPGRAGGDTKSAAPRRARGATSRSSSSSSSGSGSSNSSSSSSRSESSSSTSSSTSRSAS